MTSGAWTYELGAGVDAPRTARRALEDVGGRIESPLLDDLRLLVTELVTNGIRHTDVAPGGLLTLSVSLSEGTLRVEVHDPGGGFEAPAPAPPPADSGWGLFLVDRVADRWGVGGEATTRVWFEIDRPHSRAAS